MNVGFEGKVWVGSKRWYFVQLYPPVLVFLSYTSFPDFKSGRCL